MEENTSVRAARYGGVKLCGRLVVRELGSFTAYILKQ